MYIEKAKLLQKSSYEFYVHVAEVSPSNESGKLKETRVRKKRIWRYQLWKGIVRTFRKC